jgi:hypothetical protein
MPATVSHALSATTPDDPDYEIRPSHWNSVHLVTFSASGSEIIGAFSNSNGVSFGTEAGGGITASYTQSTHSHSTAPGAIAAGSQTATSGTVIFADSNGLAFGMSGSSQITGSYTVPTQTNQTLGFYASSNTTAQSSSSTFDARTVTFRGAGVASVGFSAGEVVISVPSGGGGLTNINVSAGTTSNNLSNIVFSNSNNVSFGLSGSTITGTATFNQTVESQSVGMSTQTAGGATAGTTGYASGGQIQYLLVPGSNITMSQSVNGASGTMSIYGPSPGGGAGNTLSEFDPFPAPQIFVTNATIGQNTLYFAPFDLPQNLSAYRVNFFLSVSTQISASNNTKSGGYTLSWCLYTRGSDTNSTRLESYISRSAFISFTASSHTRIQIGHPAGIANSTSVSQSSTSGAATNTSTYVVNSVGGFRVLPFPISSTMTPGRYWMAIAQSSTSANAQGFINCSILQLTSLQTHIAYRNWGTSSAASNASFWGPQVALGTYSATSGAFPANVPINSDTIRYPLSATLPYFNFSGYTTATNVM